MLQKMLSKLQSDEQNPAAITERVLKKRYEEQIAKMRAAIYEKEVEIARTVLPKFEEQTIQLYHCDLLEAQLKAVDFYLADPEHIGETEINTFYQNNLVKVVADMERIETDYLKERDYVLRDGVLVRIKTPEEKAHVVTQLMTTFREKELPLYQKFRFMLLADVKALRNDLAEKLQRYKGTAETLFDEYSQLLEQKSLEKDRLIQMCTAVQDHYEKQQRELFPRLAHIAHAEQLCLQGEQAALATLVTQDTKVYKCSVAAYFAERAPHALIYACASGAIEMVHYLLENGVSAVTPIRFPWGTTSYSPMDYVAQITNFEPAVIRAMLQLLKDHGAPFNAKDPRFGRTPLHSAAFAGNLAAVEWLVEQAIQEAHGDSNSVSVSEFVNLAESGRLQKSTPLHKAALYGRWFVVDYLLRYRIIKEGSGQKRNADGNTPLMDILCGDLPIEEKLRGVHLFYQYELYLSQQDIESLGEKPEFKDTLLPILRQIASVRRELTPYIDEQEAKLQAREKLEVASVEGERLSDDLSAGRYSPRHFQRATRQEMDSGAGVGEAPRGMGPS